MGTPFLLWGLVVVIGVQRLFELRLAAKNREWALANGAKEFGTEHYPIFFILHSAWFVAWILEGYWRGPQLSNLWWVWLLIFIVAQGLRYWAIASLGRYWNTQILVIPGTKPVKNGPYRFLSHPNYIAVALELASVPLIFNAWLTALIISLVNGVVLLAIRIPQEEAALAWSAQEKLALPPSLSDG